MLPRENFDFSNLRNAVLGQILHCDSRYRPFFSAGLRSRGETHKGGTFRKVIVGGRGGGGGWGKYRKKNSCKPKCPKKKFLQAETEEKIIVTEGNFTFRVKCQGIIIIKNTISFKRCYDSRFPPECPQIAFLRFWKTIFSRGACPRAPLACYIWTFSTQKHLSIQFTLTNNWSPPIKIGWHVRAIGRGKTGHGRGQ